MMRSVTIIALLTDNVQGYRVNSKKLMTEGVLPKSRSETPSVLHSFGEQRANASDLVQAGANETLESSVLTGKQAADTSAEVETGSTGRVSSLYTFGAPGVSKEALENPWGSNGCFPGKRVVNQDHNWLNQDKIDVVPISLKLVYKHPKMDALALWDDNNRELYACGSGDIHYDVPSVVMHMKATYMTRFPDKDVDLALNVSYEDDLNKAATVIQNYGFVLRASAEKGEEVSHLIENPQNGHCFLTFEGSDKSSDWMTNANVVSVDFCGLGTKVHSGFKKELMDMVELPDFQSKIRPLLSGCSKLDVVGHSLGGAVATLFTACVHSNAGSGTDEYEKIKF